MYSVRRSTKDWLYQNHTSSLAQQNWMEVAWHWYDGKCQRGCLNSSKFPSFSVLNIPMINLSNRLRPTTLGLMLVRNLFVIFMINLEFIISAHQRNQSGSWLELSVATNFGRGLKKCSSNLGLNIMKRLGVKLIKLIDENSKRRIIIWYHG